MDKTPSKLRDAKQTAGKDHTAGKPDSQEVLDPPSAGVSSETKIEGDQQKGTINLDSLDFDELPSSSHDGYQASLAKAYQVKSESLAPSILASVEQANLLEPAAPVVDMHVGMSERVRPRFGIMLVGAVFTQKLELKEGAVDALKSLQSTCESEDEMVLILEDTRNPPNLSELESLLGFKEERIWNIVRSCRGFELLSLMSSGAGDGSFDYLVGNGKVHRFAVERCFNLKSHSKSNDAWISKENGLYVGNWTACLRWIQEKRLVPITVDIDVGSWPVDEGCEGWTGERLLAVLGRGPILTGNVEGLIISRSKAIPHKTSSLISAQAKPWFRDAMAGWLKRKQVCFKEGFNLYGHPETDDAKILTLHAFIRGWDCRQPSGPMCKEYGP